jgi:hypothetical protein
LWGISEFYFSVLLDEKFTFIGDPIIETYDFDIDDRRNKEAYGACKRFCVKKRLKALLRRVR